MYNFQLGKTYRFSTRAASLLGSIVNNAKLISIMDYNTAITYDNIDLKFRTIFPTLPNGTIDSPESCVYYRFKMESDENLTFADVWIDETSIEVIEHIRFQINFENASLGDINKVRDSINALGYDNYVIKQL